MPTALIADDEEAPRAQLLLALRNAWPELDVIAQPVNGVDAWDAFLEHEPDVCFLDVRMPGLSGIEVAQRIGARAQIVFVTAYGDHALAAFDAGAVDYVLKPINAERLARTVERVRRALASAEPAGDDDARLAHTLQRLAPGAAAASAPLRYIRASQRDLTHQIPVGEILFFRADDKYTCVCTAAGEEHLIRTTIAELAAQLDPEQFWQVHRSTIVNLAYVTGTRRDELSRLYVRLRGHDGELAVSRAYVYRFKAM